jgi:acetyl esterase/lipase
VKLSFLLLLAASVIFSARGQTVASVNVQRDIVYASPGNVPQKLDLYLPATSSQTPPLVIWIHGGGWETGNKERPLALPLLKLGFAVASIDYRLSEVAKWPAQIEDCKAAVRWLRANASKYGYAGNRIGVMGASAGGHLAALLGTTANDPKLEGDEGNPGVSSAVQAVVDYFGPTDFLSLADQVTGTQRANLDNPVTHLFGTPLWNNGLVAAELQVAKDASPVYHVTAQACPFFILHGDRDPIVPLQQSVELNDALKKAGIESTLVIVKGGGHGFHDPASAMEAAAFLQRHLQTGSR